VLEVLEEMVHGRDIFFSNMPFLLFIYNIIFSSLPHIYFPHTSQKEDREGEWNKPPIIQEEAVNNMVCHLDTYKSMGLDGTHPRVLMELAEELEKPFSIICQHSWLTGEVQDDCRISNATPIYKKGKKEDPGNHRPVSLTLVPGKIMKQFILSVLNGHVKDNHDIRPSQHGVHERQLLLDQTDLL